MMRKVITVLAFVFLFGNLAGEEYVPGNSYVEFPLVVFVGQIVELTPYSVTVENTFAETKATERIIDRMIKGHSRSTHYTDHGFANALKVVSVKDDRMRMSFYLDNIIKVFDSDIRNYTKFIPVYYMFQHNIEKFKMPPNFLKDVKKYALTYYLELPMVKEILDNSWFVGVFKINPETGKLVYRASNYYKNIDELMTDDFAREHRVPDIVKAGLTVSVTKARVWGHETDKPRVKDQEDDGKGLKKKIIDDPSLRFRGSGKHR
jgi:hypothetical protein